MKRLTLLLMAVVGIVCISQAQLVTQVTSEKTITTAVDTTVITTTDLKPCELTITTRTTTDTLQWRTDNSPTWRTIYPAQTSSGYSVMNTPKIFAKKVFRKAKSGSGIVSQLWAN